MGKAYFEFLEEEYQALSSQLQKSLAVLGKKNVNDDKEAKDDDGAVKRALETQMTRCQAVLQQLSAEAIHEDAFQDRFQLYKIQMTALQDHYYHHSLLPPPNNDKAADGGRREVTYTTFRSK